MYALREYQRTLVADIRAAFAGARSVLATAPTGSGKTVVFAYITSHAALKGRRTLVLAHRREICDQISAALDMMGVRHGRIAPGHGRTEDLVQVAMVQTLSRRLGRVPAPDFIVIDEAHHAVSGAYRKVLSLWREARVLGVTATPLRLDGHGLGRVFKALVTGPETADLIERGYLAGFDYLAPPQVADLREIKTVAGDYAIGQLADAMNRSVITGDAVAHYRRHLSGRPAIAFCVTVAHAENVAAQFRAAGYRAASVDGKLDARTRKDRIAAIGDGRLNVLTSCELISEGTDIPAVAGAILLRPTKSLALYLQQVGRCLRVHPDGSRSVILDHVGNISRFGMPDAGHEWSLDDRQKKPREPSIRQCEGCFRVFASATARADAAGCDRDPCPILSVHEAEAHEIETTDGDLVVVDRERTERLRAAPLHQVVAEARTREQLEEIRVARGYRPGWTHYVMRARERRSAA